MPRIPEVQRRQLASSVVGTPGIDTSGQQIANTVSNVAGTFAGLQIQKDRQRQRALAGLQIQKDRQRQRALAVSSANNTLVDFDMALHGIGQSSNSLEEYQEEASDTLENFRSRFDDTLIKSVFDQKAATVFKERFNKAAALHERRQLLEIKNNLDQSLEKNEIRAAQLASQPIESFLIEYPALLDQWKATVAESRLALSDKEFATYNKEGSTRIAQAIVSSFAENNPGDLEEIIDILDVEKVLSPGQLQELRTTAADMLNVRKQIAERAAELEKHNTETEFSNRISNGDIPTNLELDNAALQNPDLKGGNETIKKYKQSTGRVNAVTDGLVAADILEMMYKTEGVELDGKGKITGFSDEGTPFEVLAQLRQIILLSNARKKLSQDDMVTFLSLVAPDFNTGVNETLHNFNIISSSWWKLRGRLGESTEDEMIKARAGFSMAYMRKIANEQKRLGRFLAPHELLKLRVETVEDYRANEDKWQYVGIEKGDEVWDTKNNGDHVRYRYLGTNDAGEPLVQEIFE